MNTELLPFAILAILVAIFLGLGLLVGHSWGYRDGQIAAQTGTVQYCLEKQPDLSLVWIYKEEGCEK